MPKRRPKTRNGAAASGDAASGPATAAPSAARVGAGPDPAAEPTLGAMAELLQVFAALAARHDLGTLAYLLGMARQECRALAAREDPLSASS
jgi:hypothetical protein